LGPTAHARGHETGHDAVARCSSRTHSDTLGLATARARSSSGEGLRARWAETLASVESRREPWRRPDECFSSEAGAGARSARRSLSRERSSGRSASPGCSSSSKSICGASANRASTRRARADPFAGNQTPATDSRRLIPSCRLVRSCVGWGSAICGRCEAAPLRSGFRPPVPRPGRERQLRYLEPIVGPDPSRSAGDVSLPASCAARSHRRKDPVPTPSGGRESGALRPTSPALRWPAARR
jgi:hypothetical protein